MLRLIDAETKGNLVRLYFGDYDKNTDKWYGAEKPGELPHGDDWDDAPYEHNAGPVYTRYVKLVMDVYVKWDYRVFEPNEGYLNSPFTREGLFKDEAPIIYVKTSEPYWLSEDARENDPSIVRFRMQDDMNTVVDAIDQISDIKVD